MPNFNENNTTDILKNIDDEDVATPKNKSLPKGQSENIPSNTTLEQLKLEIVDLFLDIKQIILQEVTRINIIAANYLLIGR